MMYVKGLERFKAHFEPFNDQFVLIGGTACVLSMTEAGLPFRSTKDLDIVLHVEALDGAFVRAFWDFIELGGYEHRRRSTGKDIFYRFSAPSEADFPVMIELFSRLPEGIDLVPNSHLSPIPVDESVPSLSAILLDREYDAFLRSGTANRAGLPIVLPTHLIPLKACAWLDFNARKEAGHPVDERDMRKHKNDIIRLFQLLTPTTFVSLPDQLKGDMDQFLAHLETAAVDLKSLGVRHLDLTEIVTRLRSIYGLKAPASDP